MINADFIIAGVIAFSFNCFANEIAYSLKSFSKIGFHSVIPLGKAQILHSVPLCAGPPSFSEGVALPLAGLSSHVMIPLGNTGLSLGWLRDESFIMLASAHSQIDFPILKRSFLFKSCLPCRIVNIEIRSDSIL